MENDPKTLISPNFPAEKLDAPSLEDLIDVFEDRLQGWLLGPAKKLTADAVDQVAGFALSLSYYEGIWIYRHGVDSRRRSKEFFREGFLDVFKSSGSPEAVLTSVADVLYEDGRCGFFHDAMFRTRLFFGTHFSGPFSVTLPKVNGVIDQSGEIETIVVHTAEYFRYIEGHFKKYVERLRDSSQTVLREQFETACKLKWDLQGPPRVISL